jgi:hypothetical protein
VRLNSCYDLAMTSGFTASTQPAAALFRDYIEQHGRHALTGDLAGRRYAIGHYSCPEQLGNRMMAFLNALVAAVVTNRTILCALPRISSPSPSPLPSPSP